MALAFLFYWRLVRCWFLFEVSLADVSTGYPERLFLILLTLVYSMVFVMTPGENTFDYFKQLRVPLIAGYTCTLDKTAEVFFWKAPGRV